jgi:SAM-dependent methyltransferase
VSEQTAALRRRSKYTIAAERIGRLSIAERLLVALSRHPDDIAGGYDGYGEAIEDFWLDPDALRNLTYRFPGFIGIIKGRSVMDFGCGDGQQSVAMALCGAGRVLGVEQEPIRIRRARRFGDGVANVSFLAEPSGTFDIVVSQNAFEHFMKPRETLRLMLGHLKPDGKLIITYGPPWYAPYGAHMHFFTRVPWVHLLFPERIVCKVRNAYRRPIPGGANAYRGDMNQLSIAGFLRLVAAEAVDVTMIKLACVKGWNFLGWIPTLRELFVINVACILTKPLREQSAAEDTGRVA